MGMIKIDMYLPRLYEIGQWLTLSSGRRAQVVQVFGIATNTWYRVRLEDGRELSVPADCANTDGEYIK